MTWKYVVIKIGKREVPVIFPDTFIHAHVAEGVTEKYVEAVASFTDFSEEQIRSTISFVSAGHISNLTVYGCNLSSETLGLSSRGKRDDQLINHYETRRGIME